jgi:hypothetical protein
MGFINRVGRCFQRIWNFPILSNGGYQPAGTAWVEFKTMKRALQPVADQFALAELRSKMGALIAHTISPAIRISPENQFLAHT